MTKTLKNLILLPTVSTLLSAIVAIICFFANLGISSNSVLERLRSRLYNTNHVHFLNINLLLSESSTKRQKVSEAVLQGCNHFFDRYFEMKSKTLKTSKKPLCDLLK